MSKTRKLSSTVWLLLLVAILGMGYLIMRYFEDAPRSSNYKATLVDIEKGSLTRLRISQGVRSAVLSRSTHGWQALLANGKAVPADSNEVASLVTQLKRIEPLRVQAKTRAAWPGLLLDTTGVRVEAFYEDKKVLDIIIGRSEITPERGYQTYVRLHEDSISYVSPGNAGHSVQPNVNTYRPIALFNLEADSIERIVLEDLAADSYLLLKKQDSLWCLQADVPSCIAAKQLQEQLIEVSRLSCNEFDDDFVAVGQPQRRISLHSKNTEQQLHFYRSNDEWILQSSINQGTFFRDSTAAAQAWKFSDFFLGLLQ